MKRTLTMVLGLAVGAGLVGALAGCDGGGTPPARNVQAKPPLPEGQKIDPPRPPDMSGAGSIDKPKDG